jgi:hypothetical protein
MDRKEFLKGCATGLCACAAACMPVAAGAAEPAKQEDWRGPFVKQRYAKLLASLEQKMDKTQMAAALQDVGAFCASQNDQKISKYRGDIEGYSKSFVQDSMSVVHDKARNIITAIYSPGADCTCPFNSVAHKTPAIECECSVGWARHTWGVVLGSEPTVELKESVLRGGKRCTFEIHILEQSA